MGLNSSVSKEGQVAGNLEEDIEAAFLQQLSDR
jgi:hypothetical protein